MERSTNRERIKSNCLSSSIRLENDTKSLSDTEKPWLIQSDGFPPGVTVDELKQFRKKRPCNFNRPPDNLHVGDGNLKHLKTEYGRRFRDVPATEIGNYRARPALQRELWQLDGEQPMHQGEYKMSYQNFPRSRPHLHRQESQLKTSKDVPMEFITEKADKHAPFFNFERSKSLRRATALKPEGELITETEFRREYHPHGTLAKVQPFRRPTNLKLDGLFESLTSEQKEKYIAYLINEKRLVKRRGSELKLEGPHDMVTECKTKYLPHEQRPRSIARKRSTSLKLVGELEFWPEYRNNFVDLPRSRSIVPHPRDALQSEGELELDTETRSKYVDFAHFNVPESAKRNNNIQLEGSLDISPEYRDKFISFGRSKSDIIRHSDNLTLEGDHCFETEQDKYRSSADLSKTMSTSTSKKETPAGITSKSVPPIVFNSKPEYKSQYVDFPRKRPTVLKPIGNLTSSGDFENLTEKRSQYQSYGVVPRTTPRNRPANLHVEGGVDGEGEYRSKFIEHPVNFQRTPKPIDSLPKEYPSFQVLDVKGKEGGSEPPEPIYPTTVSSPNSQPSFRLEVHNTDSKPRGFHRSPERIFPQEAIANHPYTSSIDKEAAFEAALRRKASFDRKNLNSPIESRPLSGKKVESGASSAGKTRERFDENGNDRSFVILDNVNHFSTKGSDGIEEPGSVWQPPAWMDSTQIPQSIIS